MIEAIAGGCTGAGHPTELLPRHMRHVRCCSHLCAVVAQWWLIKQLLAALQHMAPNHDTGAQH